MDPTPHVPIPRPLERPCPTCGAGVGNYCYTVPTPDGRVRPCCCWARVARRVVDVADL
jgi:hypothetical protein